MGKNNKISGYKTSVTPKKETDYYNSRYVCDYCNATFTNKQGIIKHLAICNLGRKCEWCNLVFKNRGNLVRHTYHMHGNKSYKSLTNKTSYKCDVCEKSFSQKFRMFYHIRRTHYNLHAKIPHCQFKNINQVWFEKVQNSDTVVEIKKTGYNTLMIRKTNELKYIEDEKYDQEVIDLSHLYPTDSSKKIQCNICNKFCLQRMFKKHYEERHLHLKKHKCNNCQATFSRSYIYLKHVCNKPRKPKSGIPVKKILNIKPLTVT